jgi:hypothetical protein
MRVLSPGNFAHTQKPNMKIRSLLCSLSLALALPLGLNAQGGKEPETELGGKMDKIGAAFRALRRPDPTTKVASIADPAKNADSLAKVAIIRENATAALKLEPALKASKPAGEQAKFVADYQAKMKEFLVIVEKLEAALKANDNATAAKLVDSMNSSQKEAHDSFKKGKKKG